MNLTVGILTFNSAATLAEAIRSAPARSSVIVCDGGSTDGTREIATALGASVIDQDARFKDTNTRLIDIAGVREQILTAAQTDWVFFLDSDEMSTRALNAELDEVTRRRSPAAYRVPRRFVVDGHVIEHASTYPSFQLRLVNRQFVKAYEGLVHDRPVLPDGAEVGDLREAQLVPLGPVRELWRRWRAYWRLEEVKRAAQARDDWWARTAKPQLKTSYRFAKRTAFLMIRRRPNRLPLRYEVSRVVYELGVIVYTGRRFVGWRRADLDGAWGTVG